MKLNSSKKELLQNIVGGSPVLGAATAGQTVKFQYATTIAKAATSTTAGAITFAAGEHGSGAIYVSNGENTTLVSSKILDVSWGAKSGAKHSAKTITVTYIGNAGAESTQTLDVIDEAALEAYFDGSKTIDLSTNNVFEVKTKADGGIKVDDTDGLYVDIADLFGVDSSTIGFNADNKLRTLVKLAYNASGNASKPALQLQDVNGNYMSEIEVEDIIGSGIVKSTNYDPATNKLIIVWKGDPEVTTEIDLKAILDVLNDVTIAEGSTDYLTAVADSSTIKFGVTDKVKAAIALGETAVQNVTKATSVENYVDLTVTTKTTDTSVITVAINDADLKTKIDEIDTSIIDVSARLASSVASIDASIDRLDSSVSGIETKIAAMDADLATAELNVGEGTKVYTKVSLKETDGVINTLAVSNQIAATSVTDYDSSDTTNTPAFTVSTKGLLTDADATNLAHYVDEVAEKIKEQGVDSLDASLSDNDTPNFISTHIEQKDGEIIDFTIDSSYGVFGAVSRGSGNVASATDATNGIAKVADTQTWVMGILNGLDKAADAKSDTYSFVTTTISETDGIVSNDSVTVVYGVATGSPGTINMTSDGIVAASTMKAAVEGALTWTVLS